MTEADAAPAAPPSVRESVEAAAAELESAPEGMAEPSSVEGGAKLETTPEPAASKDESVKADNEAINADGRARDEHGRFTKGEATPGRPQPPKPPPKPTQPTKPVPAPTQPAAEASSTQPPEAGKPQATEYKPPQAWKATAREQWSKLTPDIQAEVSRREREFQAEIDANAEARRLHQAFRQVVSPFEHMIRAEGGEPLNAVHNLLATSAALRTAPVGQKAQIVASIISTFGVPLDAINAALPGAAGQSSGSMPAQQPEMRDPRFDQFIAGLQQQAQARQSEVQSRASAEVSAFAKEAEFFEDVKGTVRLVLLTDAQAKQGNPAAAPMTLKEAYEVALRMPQHKDVWDVVQQREAAKTAQSSQAAIQRAKNASSSIRSQPTGSPAVKNGAPPTIRESIEEAARELSGR